VRSATHCSHCLHVGHNRATCPDLPKKPPRAKDPSGKSWRATEWLRESGGTLLGAAKRFHVSRQAVHAMWEARGLGALPTQQKRAEIIGSIRRFDGLPAREIAAQTGLSTSTIGRLARKIGICVAPRPNLSDQIRPDVEELLPRIRAREVTLTDVAHQLGVTHQVLHETLKTLVDEPLDLSSRGQDYRGRVDGKSKAQRASELVDAGVSVREASAQIGVATRCVYKYRKSKGVAPSVKERR